MNLDINFVTSFIALQRKLLFAFVAVNPEVKDYRWLLDFPKRGMVEVDGEEWEFVKHGAGLRFVRKSPEPHVIVDVHNHLEEARIVDTWRLLQFSESSGEAVDSEQLSLLLEKMCLGGYLIRQEAGQYLSTKESNGAGTQ